MNGVFSMREGVFNSIANPDYVQSVRLVSLCGIKSMFL